MSEEKKIEVEDQDNTENSEDSSIDEIEELDPLEELETEIEQLKDKHLRLVAEMDNIKKRHIKERSELLKYAGENLARDLLEVVDHLQLAAKQEVADSNDAANKIKDGVDMIVAKFISILSQHGIKTESAVGEIFDPYKHEALVMQKNSEFPNGTVIEEFKQAYFFKDKLLRPAQVVVAQGDDSEVIE